MKVLIISNPYSAHTIKWVSALSDEGIETALFSIPPVDESILKKLKGVSIYSGNIDKSHFNKADGSLSKLVYLKSLPELRSAVLNFQPDILHAHYATSSGLLGVLSGFHPLIISVWGADVYDFPKRSFLHSLLLKFILSRADKVLSTSNTMAKQAKIFTRRAVEVIPFGIDLDKFKPEKVGSIFDENPIVIGTVKSLEAKYGIEYLIRAFEVVRKKYSGLRLKLLIVGGGTQGEELRKLASSLNINDDVIFAGRVPVDDVPRYQNMLDIPVVVSTLESESFGVSVLEASACEKPVIVSRIGGLPEVVEENVTGLIVEPKNYLQTADAIEKLLLDDELRTKMGKAGRARVERNYNFKDNIAQMINIYKSLC